MSERHLEEQAVKPISRRSPQWLGLAADRIVELAGAGKVLDIDCGRGDLVATLVAKGLDAHGLSASESELSAAGVAVRDRLALATTPPKLAGPFDLIICVQTLETLPAAQVEQLMDAMCAASDRVLVSSAPGEFHLPETINAKQPWVWAAGFAERGFYRRTDLDLSAVSPWAMVFEAAEPTRRDLVFRYESVLAPISAELQVKRAALAKAASSEASSTAERELRHQLLISRDHAIGAEAELGTLRAENARLHAQLATGAEAARFQEAVLRDLAEVRASATWRIGRAVVGPADRLRAMSRIGRRR